MNEDTDRKWETHQRLYFMCESSGSDKSVSFKRVYPSKDLQEVLVEVLFPTDSYSLNYLFNRNVGITTYNLLVGKSSIQANVHSN